MDQLNIESYRYAHEKIRYQPDDERTRHLQRTVTEKRSTSFNRFFYRTLAGLGNLLVALGSRLQSYQEVVVVANSEGKPSTC